MSRYILVGQNGIARIKKTTDKETIGLSAQIETCVALILIGKDEVSLLHGDSSTDFSPFLEEMKAIDKPSKIIVARKKTNFKEGDPRAEGYDRAYNHCIQFLKENQFDTRFKCVAATTETSCVNITRQGHYSTAVFLDETSSPEKTVRDAIHWFNLIFSKTRPAVLEFDGADFSALPLLAPLGSILLGRVERNLRARGIETNKVSDIEEEMKNIFQSRLFCMYTNARLMNQDNFKMLVSDAKTLLDNQFSIKGATLFESLSVGKGRVTMALQLFSGALCHAPREIQHDVLLESFALRR